MRRNSGISIRLPVTTAIYAKGDIKEICEQSEPGLDGGSLLPNG